MTKEQKQIYKWLLSKSSYLKKSASWLFIANIGSPNGSMQDYEIALKQARKDSKKPSLEKYHDASIKIKPFKDTVWGKKMVEAYRNAKPEDLTKNSYTVIPQIKNYSGSSKYDPNNTIWLPDLHAPFIKKGVLEFCREQQDKYKCGTVRFAGDIIDGHAWSYHEHDPDGMSVGDELHTARLQLKPWFKAFPNATVCMGNHDLLIQRKARTIGLSKYFIRGFGEVIGAPKTWEFGLEFRKDNVLYKHGNIGDAFIVAKKSRMSTCQGHFHAKTFVQWSVSEKDAIFGLQVGWGADREAYAFDYGKSFSDKPVISCGLILDKGTTPIVKLMEL
jgi:hypothetical protein